MGRRNVWQEKGYELKQSRKLNRKIEAKLSRKTGILVKRRNEMAGYCIFGISLHLKGNYGVRILMITLCMHLQLLFTIC